MRQLAFAAAVACVVAMQNTIAEEHVTNLTSRATVVLSDGSRIVGSCRTNAMTFRLSFGKVELLLEVVASVTMKRDGETAVIHLRNQDRLSGVPVADVLPIETVFGSFNIPLTVIKEVSFSGVVTAKNVDLYYSFDDAGDVVADASGKNRRGQTVRVEYRADGVSGKSAWFTNGAHIVVGGESVLFDGDFTIAAWLCVERLASGEWEHMIVSQWTGQPRRGMRFSVRGPMDGQNAGKLCLIGDTGHNVGLSDTSVLQGRWRHVAVVYQRDGQKVSFYVDGRLDGTATGHGSVSSAQTELVVGCASWARGLNGFIGVMDDLVVASRVMNETEVKSLYEDKQTRSGSLPEW